MPVSNPAATIFQQATEKYHIGQYAEAIELFASANYISPHMAGSHYPDLIRQVQALIFAADAYSKSRN